MKSVFLACTFVLSLTTFAQANNPQIRTCQRQQGQYFVAENSQDQFGFCQFDSAFVGALDLFYFLDTATTTTALQAYRGGLKQCESFGRRLTLKVVEGSPIEVCRFEDGSFISLRTLLLGVHATENQKLNQALGFTK